MSKIDEMLKRMCPDGVEYVELGKVCELTRGSGLQKSDKGTGNVPIILYGELYTEYGNYIKQVTSYASEGATKNCKVASRGDILMPISSTTKEAQIGKASVLFCDQACNGGDMLILKHRQDPSYLMYVVNSKAFEVQKMKYVRGTTIMHLQPSGIAKIKVPLPPLEIQKEIVKVLDAFAEYDTELQSELQARIKQYEYYRDKLLSFDENVHRGGVAYKPLGEVCDTVTDFVAAGSFAEMAKRVKYLAGPDYALLVRTMDLKNNFTSRNLVYIDKDAYDFLWRVQLDGHESIILPNIGNCGEVYYVNDSIPYAHCALATNAILVRSSIANNRFLFHMFGSQSFQTKLKRIISPTGQTKFNKTDLKKIIIPIPPLDVQSHIISVLDNLDEICSDLKSGLPAEIENRQKQYGYYLDKMLDFKVKA